MTTDTFLAEEATAKEDRIIHHAVSTVKDDANDLAMQLRVKDVGKETLCGRCSVSGRVVAGGRLCNARCFSCQSSSPVRT